MISHSIFYLNQTFDLKVMENCQIKNFYAILFLYSNMTSLRRKFKLQKVKTTVVGRKMEGVTHKKLFFQATCWKIYLE